jgi:hypothetical protein
MHGSEYLYVAYCWSNFDSIDGQKEGEGTKRSMRCICNQNIFPDM